MLRPHRPPHRLIQFSGHLLKYFCVGCLGCMVALLTAGVLGAAPLIPPLLTFLIPIVVKLFAVILCITFIAVLKESIR